MTSDFIDPIECYQAIGDGLVKAVTEPWSDIHVAVDLDGDAVTIVKTYQPSSGGRRKDVAFIPMLGQYFHQLGRILTSRPEGAFKHCHFVVTSDGSYDVKFTY